MAIVLYDFLSSASCYKVRHLLSILDLDYEQRLVDYFPGRRHREPDFLELNPLGQIPVLLDGDLVLRDAQAILVYLASRYDPAGTWYPDEAATRGRVAMWLAFAGGELAPAGQARLHDVLGLTCDIDAARTAAHHALRILDDHLIQLEFQGRDWLAADHPTVADLACFPYSALSHEGGVGRDHYHALERWLHRVAALPGSPELPGTPLLGRNTNSR